jgi:hypothetical protein
VEASRLRTKITELRHELCRRDEKHKEEIKVYKDALVEMQKELVEVKQTVTMTTTNTTACTCNGHYEELRAELQSLRTAVTSPEYRPELGIDCVTIIRGVVQHPGGACRTWPPCCDTGSAFCWG